MIVYLFLAAAYPVAGFEPYWAYVITGYLAIGVPAVFLMVLNRRYLVPKEYRLYGELMRFSEPLPSRLNNGGHVDPEHEATTLAPTRSVPGRKPPR